MSKKSVCCGVMRLTFNLWVALVLDYIYELTCSVAFSGCSVLCAALASLLCSCVQSHKSKTSDTSRFPGADLHCEQGTL